MWHGSLEVLRLLFSDTPINIFEKIIDDRLWINPGSCGRRRFDQEITMAVMHVDAGRYQVEKNSY